MRLVLDRLVIREVLPPATMGFVVYTFLLIMRGLFSLMEQVFVRGLSGHDAWRVLAATLPNVVVLTIPMAFLFGVLLAMGRMTSDNEVIALQAAGIPATRLLRPIILLAVTLFALNSWIYLEVLPRTGRELRELKTEMYSGSKNFGRIDAHVFYEELPDLLLYVRSVDSDTNEWQDVLVYNSSNPNEEQLTLAQRGRILSSPRDNGTSANSGNETPTGSEPWLVLEDVVTHQFFRDKPDTYRANRTPEQLVRPRFKSQGSTRVNLGISERSSAELLAMVRSGNVTPSDGQSVDPERRREMLVQAQLELHKRIAIPASCLAFALLALPLGVGSRGGGRGRGFVISLGVVLVYYVMINNGELLALQGKVPPWLGMWLPNIALSILGLWLMRKMGRWLGERQGRENLVKRLWSRWRRSRRLRGIADSPLDSRQLTGSIPINLQRRRFTAGFPTMLDRYVTRRLVVPVMFVLVSTLALYVVVDLTQNIDDMAKNHAPLNVIAGYYWNIMPQAMTEVVPFGLMIGVLILLTVLERQLELTALKAAGVSLYRLLVPVLLVGMAGAISMWLLSESVVPRANTNSKRLLDRIKGRETSRSYLATDRQWLVSRDERSFYNYLRFDPEEQAVIPFTMFTVDDAMRLRFHLVAPRLMYRDGGWVADGGWYRSIDESGVDSFHRIQSPMEVNVPESPSYFGQEFRRPDEMSYRDLGIYIQALRDSGYQPGRLVVRWHQKFSYPLSAFVLVLLALPYGLNRGGRRSSTMQGVAIALSLGMGYLIVMTLFGKMGEAGLLDPRVAAWAPVLLAGLFAVNRLTTMRT